MKILGKEVTMSSEQVNQELALGKHAITYAAGVATALGLMTAVDSATLTSSIDRIINGVEEISVGLGPVIALVMGLWARYNASRGAKIASLTATSGTMVVDVGAASPAAVAEQLAAVPGVAKVISTPAVAQAAPSDKVVSQ